MTGDESDVINMKKELNILQEFVVCYQKRCCKYEERV